jgi:hypothetical protein
MTKNQQHEERNSMTYVTTSQPPFNGDVTSTAPLPWAIAARDSKNFIGRELLLVLNLAAYAGKYTGRIDACDAGCDETAFKLGVNVNKVRDARKAAEDCGYLVELSDGCLQLTVPA